MFFSYLSRPSLLGPSPSDSFNGVTSTYDAHSSRVSIGFYDFISRTDVSGPFSTAENLKISKNHEFFQSNRLGGTDISFWNFKNSHQNTCRSTRVCRQNHSREVILPRRELHLDLSRCDIAAIYSIWWPSPGARFGTSFGCVCKLFMKK